MSNKIIEFIQERFPVDCNWLTGNCYYFAQILKSRFPEGEIYYDVVFGHFLFAYEGQFYDWNGISQYVSTPIKWSDFQTEYDHLQYERIIRDCIY